MANHTYVDSASVWVEGMHVAAVDYGMVPDIWTAQQQRICGRWSFDFGRLLTFAGGDSPGRVTLYGTRPPPNDSLWRLAEKNHLEVVVNDKNVRNRPMRYTTTIVRDIVKDSLLEMKAGSDEVTLVAGDADYVPVAEDLKERGIQFHVVFWDHVARELREASSKFVTLNTYLEHLRVK